MRKYRVSVRAPVGTMTTHVLAESYQDAEKKVLEWADNSYLHAQFGPWTCYECEVAA